MLVVERPWRAELLLLLVLAPSAAPAQTQEPTVVRLRDAVGDTIDLAERDSFRLFPSTADFHHAVILALPGPEFFAQVTLAGTDTTTQVYVRIMPTELERIRFLIGNREYMAGQVRSDSSAALALASFWQEIEGRPLQSIAGEPTDVQSIARVPADAATAAGQQTQPATDENRYHCTLLGTTGGSALGGCIGSWTGIKQVRTEYHSCFGNFYSEPIYAVNHPLFWTAACGLTALGSYAGYATGAKLDRRPPSSLPKEGKGWRTGCAMGAAIPGLLLGISFFALAGGTHFGATEFLGQIENDEPGLTVLPMALTGLCIAVEVTTIGYHIGRSIDRSNAQKAEAKRRELGR